MKTLLRFLLPFLLCTQVGAATFPLFQPSTGVLKGNANTYVTTPAASSDIISLWSGTCNSSSALRGDGTCQTVTTGTVTSVGLTAPSGFTVTGSPVTGTGTLAISTTLSGPLKGTGSGLAAAASSDIIGLWSGTCNSGTFLRADGSCQAAGGGTPGGSTTQVQYNNAGSFAGSAKMVWDNANTIFKLTDATNPPIMYLEGTSVANPQISFLSSGSVSWKIQPSYTDTFTIENASANPAFKLNNLTSVMSVPSSWDIQIGSTSVCRSNGTNCPAGGGTPGNPTASVGLSAVNGVATTFMRSDGAPALSQSISPTWTGTHTWSNPLNGTYNDIAAGPLAAFVANSNSPHYAWNEADQAANGRLWRAYVNGGTFNIQPCNDALSSCSQGIGLVRSGAAMSSITFGNATDNPTYTFSGTGATAFGGPITVNTAAGSAGIVLNTPAAAADRKNTVIRNGSLGDFAISTATDAAPTSPVKNIFVANKTGTTAIGSIDIGNATDNPSFTVNGNDVTPVMGSFTATFTGCTVSPTPTIRYYKVGSFVTLYIATSSCTSNATTFNASAALPATLIPSTNRYAGTLVGTNNSVVGVACIYVQTNGTIVAGNLTGGACVTGGWTASGNKDVGGSVTYYLN